MTPDSVDIAVIGSGPAGMAAATCAADHGASVVLLDEQQTPGGQIYRAVTAVTEAQSKILGKDYLDGRVLTDRLAQSSVQLIAGATVWSIDNNAIVTYSQQQSAYRLQAKTVIIATGALERPYPIPGWTLPGVMTVGAAQILLKTSNLVPQKPILAGTGPLLYTVANQFIKAGVDITAIVDTVSPAHYIKAAKHFPAFTPGYIATGLSYLKNIKTANIPHYKNCRALKVTGANTATGIEFQHNGKHLTFATHTVLLHQGVIPNTQLSRSLRLDHYWHPLQRCFHPTVDDWGKTSNNSIKIAGDGAGIGGAIIAEQQGTITALGALADLEIITLKTSTTLATTAKRAARKLTRLRTFLDTLYAPPSECFAPANDTIICRCEEVTAGDIREYAQLGCVGPNQTKSFGRCGMGPCQGRYCGNTVTEILAAQHNLTHDEVGAYRIRTPVKPVTLQELASLHD